jgi:predicted aspartyl protease
LTGKCAVDNTSSAPVVAQSPLVSTPVTAQVAAPQASDRVPFTYAGGEIHVPVALSGYPVTMVVDTGATIMTVSETVANSLVNNGRASFTGNVATVTLADNSTRSEREISINSLTVGNHTIQHVIAHVAPDGSEMLLGHLVLARLAPKFGINVASSTLEFN